MYISDLVARSRCTACPCTPHLAHIRRWLQRPACGQQSEQVLAQHYTHDGGLAISVHVGHREAIVLTVLQHSHEVGHLHAWIKHLVLVEYSMHVVQNTTQLYITTSIQRAISMHQCHGQHAAGPSHHTAYGAQQESMTGTRAALPGQASATTTKQGYHQCDTYFLHSVEDDGRLAAALLGSDVPEEGL